MAGDNSTSDTHALGPQLSVADIVIIAVYFALNLVVGVWVRELRQGTGTGGIPRGVCSVSGGGWCPRGPCSQPWGRFVRDLDLPPFSLWTTVSQPLK